MEIKLFEIRDSATFIPALAIKLHGRTTEEGFLLGRVGFSGVDSIVLMRLSDQESHADLYGWENRTMQTAHKYIEENFDLLTSGYVVDVQYLLGETSQKKMSERMADY